MNEEHVLKILKKHEEQEGGLISILEDIQTKYRHLPEDALRIVAEKTGRPLTDVYGVATFYKSFSLKPRGKHLVSVCLGTACHVRRAPAVAKEFERQLGISPGDTTDDELFTLETVNCLGACALGPIVVVDGHYFSKVTPGRVKRIIDKALAGLDEIDVESDERIFPVEVRCPRCNHSLMDSDHPIDGQPSIRLTASFGRHHCWIRLSSLYGSYHIESKFEIPDDTVVHCFCPHCHADLITGWNCAVCGAPMIPMLIHGGGMIQVCSRRGCREHMLDVDASGASSEE